MIVLSNNPMHRILFRHHLLINLITNGPILGPVNVDSLGML
jgi:hypothetical protein